MGIDRAAMLLAAVGLLTATVSAQTSLALDPGSRVRLSLRDGQKITGRVDGLPGSAIVIMPEGRTTTMSVPLGTIEHVDLSRGPRSRKAAAWKKAKWGIVIGAVPGAISAGLQHETIGENGSSVGHAAALGAWSGGLVGGLIGAAIGAASPGENWERIR